MRKPIIFCSLLLLCLCFTACSNKNKFPDDFVVILPDKQELYLYMPRDEAEAILGEGIVDERNNYCYDDIGIEVQYYMDKLSFVKLRYDTVCLLKSGIHSGFKEEEFLEADFIVTDVRPEKYYSISDEKYTLIKEKPERPSFDDFKKNMMFYIFTPYIEESDPDFGKYNLYIGDYTCLYYGFSDK